MNRVISTASPQVLRLSEDDNVVIALQPLEAGTLLEGELKTATEIPAGHKVATLALSPGDRVVKYGQIIAEITQPVQPGEQVHTHNSKMVEFERQHPVGTNVKEPDSAKEERTFQGIIRADGRVATRNYVGIVTTVNCAATVAKAVASHFDRKGLDEFENVDGVVALCHAAGCGTVSQGESFDLMQRTLAGYVTHPNFAGVLVLGLGCEVNQASRLMDDFGIEVGARVATMNIQDTGGTRQTIDRAIAVVEEMCHAANHASRTPVSTKHLKLALQCGGSDGFSGITANPALGRAADLLVAHGGTVILAETPEVYGAEHLLTARARRPETAEKLLKRIEWWREYTETRGAELDSNPSVGNKAGGLTTILEKSLGAVAKSGTSPLEDVVCYAEPVTRAGFNFMDSPGYDPCSVTGQVASGANVVCFTTGRGSVFGFKPAPSIKLATNSTLYRRMGDDMDINCGALAEGESSLEELGQEIFETVLRVASGEPSRSEALGVGDNEFVPWLVGATM